MANRIIGAGGKALEITESGIVFDGKNIPDITQFKKVNGVDIVGSGDITTALPYGISWNQETDTYTRLGFNDLSVQKTMRRCVLNADGTVNYYLDPNDSTKKADGNDAILDGSDGDVMVEIKKFYYKYEYSGGTHTWLISLYPFSGAVVHPAFITKNGGEHEYIYVSAFKVNNEGKSVAAKPGDDRSLDKWWPKTDITRPDMRDLIRKKGGSDVIPGWNI